MNLDFKTPWHQLGQMLNGLLASLPRPIIASLVFLVVFYGSRLIRALVRHASLRARAPENAALVLGRIAQWLTVFLGLLVALSILLPSFKAGQLIELLGISSVAIGFAFRDIFTNFLAGIIILLTQPFRIGDQIMVNNYEGVVETIQTRATMITTYDGRRVVIPNATIFGQSVTVNTAYAMRRSECRVEVNPAQVDRARRLLVETIARVPGVAAAPAPEALLSGFNDGTYLRLFWWTASPKAAVIHVESAVLDAVNEILNRDDVAAPLPQETIFLHDAQQHGNGAAAPEPARSP